MTTTFLLRTEEEAMRYLQSRDKRLGAVIEQIGPIERRGNADLFASTVRHIISQQISKKAQQTVWMWFPGRGRGYFPSPGCDNPYKPLPYPDFPLYSTGR
jgi:3-methyladenine DNA glycosylase/8-oxoguanine DNA glycosylase